MPDENVRLNITLSNHVYRQLKNWAAYHGKPPTTYAGQIVSARIEANLDTIAKLIESAAEAEGISAEQLEQRWQSDGND